jgi:hypothetical protein
MCVHINFGTFKTRKEEVGMVIGHGKRVMYFTHTQTHTHTCDPFKQSAHQHYAQCCVSITVDIHKRFLFSAVQIWKQRAQNGMETKSSMVWKQRAQYGMETKSTAGLSHAVFLYFIPCVSKHCNCAIKS